MEGQHKPRPSISLSFTLGVWPPSGERLSCYLQKVSSSLLGSQVWASTWWVVTGSLTCGRRTSSFAMLKLLTPRERTLPLATRASIARHVGTWLLLNDSSITGCPHERERFVDVETFLRKERELPFHWGDENLHVSVMLESDRPVHMQHVHIVYPQRGKTRAQPLSTSAVAW